MDIANPTASVFPGAHGAVLTVLARTYEPLSGRRVAALTNGRVGASRAARVLAELTSAGVVLCEERPPAKLYRLNREHVAAEAIGTLTDLWTILVEKVRAELATWNVPPWSACLFGSAARGEAGPNSDIDILILVDDTGARHTPDTDPEWDAQIDRLAERVQAWSGNACEVLELTVTELRDAVERDDRLVRDLRADALPLAGEPIGSLIARQRVTR